MRTKLSKLRTITGKIEFMNISNADDNDDAVKVRNVVGVLLRYNTTDGNDVVVNRSMALSIRTMLSMSFANKQLFRVTGEQNKIRQPGHIL